MLFSSLVPMALTIAVGMVTASGPPHESHAPTPSDNAMYFGDIFDKAIKAFSMVKPEHGRDEKSSSDHRDQTKGVLHKALHSFLNDDELKQLDGTLDLLADKVGHLVSRDVESEDSDDKYFPPEMFENVGPANSNPVPIEPRPAHPLPVVDTDVNDDGRVNKLDIILMYWEYATGKIDRVTYLEFLKAYKAKTDKTQGLVDHIIIPPELPEPIPKADPSHPKRSIQANDAVSGEVRWQRKPPAVVERLPCDCKNVIKSIVEPRPKEGMTHEWYEGWTKKFYSQLRWREECFEICVDEAMHDFITKLKWLRTHDPRLKIKPNEIAPEPKDPVKQLTEHEKRWERVENPNTGTHTYELDGTLAEEYLNPEPKWKGSEDKRDLPAQSAAVANAIRTYRDWWLHSHKTGKFCNCKAQETSASWSWISAMPKSNKRCAGVCNDLGNFPLEKPNGTVTVPVYKGRPQVPADGHFDVVPEPEKPSGTVTVPIHRDPERPADAAADLVSEKSGVDQPAHDESA